MRGVFQCDEKVAKAVGGGRAERAGDGDCGGGGGKRVLLRILPGLKEGEVVKNLHQLLYGLGR